MCRAFPGTIPRSPRSWSTWAATSPEERSTASVHPRRLPEPCAPGRACAILSGRIGKGMSMPKKNKTVPHRHVLYEASVQSLEADLDFVEEYVEAGVSV